MMLATLTLLSSGWVSGVHRDSSPWLMKEPNAITEARSVLVGAESIPHAGPVLKTKTTVCIWLAKGRPQY